MIALVTGAAGGIGAEISRCFAAKGSDLILVDRDEQGLEALGDELGSYDVRCTFADTDLSDPSAIDRLAERVSAQTDKLDALVSNAGIFPRAELVDLTLDDYDRTFAVNTRATWLLAKAFFPHLREARGALVATASLSATQQTSPLGAYSASKSALTMLVKQLAYEWGPSGVRCNCVSPGFIRTPATEPVYQDPEFLSRRTSQIPLGRVGQPRDIAQVVEFLVSAQSGYVTGQEILVDGGLNSVLMPILRGAAQISTH
jgi:NAD(P)-dependent dehydrogenase (short-subunit alcohol dehydrogenase family)